MPDTIPLRLGREIFGGDPHSYDRFRPAYPAALFELLADRCGLGAATCAFEVGPGTGQATRELLRRGVIRLTLIEPNRHLAGYLRNNLAPSSDTVAIIEEGFEDAPLPPDGFDLGVAATSFHWIEEDAGLAKVANTLRPGGWWAMWWTQNADRERADPFRDAAGSLLAPLAPGPTGGTRDGLHFSEDRETRTAAIANTGRLEAIGYEQIRWSLSLNATQLRGLYSTFSPVLNLEEPSRSVLLDELERIAREDFGNHVERPVVTRVYTARKHRAGST